ncbi:hypothetical protein DMN91_004760 [Ooceraea biroi]|uniref:Ig-like domain-containing protein n=1 Tax=Ooceraea biroi TaxID=2015173 RepID=A0A3L8DQF1_OOCBI|nr:cell adhesion molecule 2 isoform X1 [Ooceraea biroi]XP_011347602.1 cell adhesion molecule 2 isoform X1 [Ooceraea biroi]XP_011347603.1 cell adhesion molecule 2 isoform X1 [Ooceraea biroi]XP_011347604.1 cell adhesion molecule 2 isoform X1 [Ooceraea biroi]RLU22482.1 hypothetical protein DMN91_004760 [Ooceraea biroi]
MRELRAMDFVLLLLVMLLRQEVAGLKLQHIRVPTYLLSGENAFLECGYDLETEKLYAISWYKDQEEFYKFIARGETNKHSYPVAGVKVDYRHSDDHQVILQNVSLHTSGQYRCEISAEAPSFEAVSGEASMEIIELSQEKPVIVGEEKVYASGDVLALNCTSGKSHPAAQLKWFVNGQQVKPNLEIVFEQHGLYSTISTLLLVLEPGHLVGDKINVRCEATVRSSRADVAQPFIDMRATEVFVQGHASFATPSLCLLAVAVLQRLLLPV